MAFLQLWKKMFGVFAATQMIPDPVSPELHEVNSRFLSHVSSLPLFFSPWMRQDACQSLVRNGHRSIISSPPPSSPPCSRHAGTSRESSERRRERKREMTINRLSHHLRRRYARQLEDGRTDGQIERENETQRCRRRHRVKERERVGVLYAHYAQIRPCVLAHPVARGQQRSK